VGPFTLPIIFVSVVVVVVVGDDSVAATSQGIMARKEDKLAAHRTLLIAADFKNLGICLVVGCLKILVLALQ